MSDQSAEQVEDVGIDESILNTTYMAGGATSGATSGLKHINKNIEKYR